jgi:hypothetical protein
VVKGRDNFIHKAHDVCVVHEGWKVRDEKTQLGACAMVLKNV